MDQDTRQRIADGEACLEAALKYLKLGLSPLALCPPDHVGVSRVSKGHSKTCKTPGKRPWHTWKEFQTRPATEEEIRRFWDQLPNSNVGNATGPASKTIRIDVDSPGAEFKLQALSGGLLPPTWEFTGDTTEPSRRGLLYQIPEGAVLQTTHQEPSNDKELRLQAEGAQTVLPPSRHPKGMLYAWKTGHSPDDIPLALMPEWLVREMSVPESVRGQGSPSSNGKGRPPGAGKVPEIFHDGKRHTYLLSLAGTMRRRGMDSEEILAGLLAVNERRCDPPLGADEIGALASDVADRYQPVDADQEETNEALRLGQPLDFLKSRKCFQRIPLAKVRKLGVERGEFGLVLDDGRTIELGKAKEVLAPRDVQGAIADMLHIAIPEYKRSEWRPIAEAIFTAAVVDDQPQTSEADETKIWLVGFATRRARLREYIVDLKDATSLAAALLKITNRADFAEHSEDGRFWTTNHELVVHAPLFMAFVSNPATFNARITQAQATLRLRRVGFQKKQFAARHPQGTAKAKLWISPPGFLDEYFVREEKTLDLEPSHEVQQNGRVDEPT